MRFLRQWPFILWHWAQLLVPGTWQAIMKRLASVIFALVVVPTVASQPQSGELLAIHAELDGLVDTLTNWPTYAAGNPEDIDPAIEDLFSLRIYVDNAVLITKMFEEFKCDGGREGALRLLKTEYKAISDFIDSIKLGEFIASAGYHAIDPDLIDVFKEVQPVVNRLETLLAPHTG